MPIVRTYACAECNHFMRVTLTAEQVDDPPPECPQCAATGMSQEFYAPGILGSKKSKAVALAEDIAARDYNVADMTGVVSTTREGDRQKVRYKDQNKQHGATWEGNREMLETAIAVGRGTRKQYGSGLDVIKQMPDLIAISKGRSTRIW
jgi:hypothetical protein